VVGDQLCETSFKLPISERVVALVENSISANTRSKARAQSVPLNRL
jgi:hypothetical protein